MAGEVGKMGAKLQGKAKAADAVLQGEIGILRHLAAEHGEVAALMRSVAKTEDIEQREQLFADVRSKLLAHAEAEEAEFYPVLRGQPQLVDLVERSLADHREVESLIEDLTSGAKSNAEWRQTFARLQQAVEEHVQLEEQQIFPLTKKLFDAGQLRQMLERYEPQEKSAQQRLH